MDPRRVHPVRHGAAALLLALAANSSGASAAAAAEPASHVAIKANELRAIGGRRALVVEVANQAHRPLWLRVRFATPRPEEACEETRKVLPLRRFESVCFPEHLEAGADVPVTVSVFDSEEPAPVLEEVAVAVPVSARRLKNVEEEVDLQRRLHAAEAETLTRARALPRTFTGILAPKGFLPKRPFGKPGTVTVSRTELVIESDKKRAAIPLAEIEAVDWVSPPEAIPDTGPMHLPGAVIGAPPIPRAFGGTDVWVSLTYREGGGRDYRCLWPKEEEGFDETLHALYLTVEIARLGDSGPLPVPGDSRAGLGLQIAALWKLLAAGPERAGICRALRVAGTEVLFAENLSPSAPPENWHERWTVDRCGSAERWRLHFHPDTFGGATLRLTAEPDGEPAPPP